MKLRDELQYIFRQAAASASEIADEMLLAEAENRRARVDTANDRLKALYALNIGLREALFRLADRVEDTEARLGPEDSS